MVTKPREYDVVVVGAGLIGAALGCALAESRLTVLVVDASPAPEPLSHEPDLRVSAISLSSERILQAIECWEPIASHAVSPFRRMYVWDACGRGRIEFDCAEIGATHLGHIIENSLIVDQLLQRAHASPNVDLWRPADVLQINSHSDGVAMMIRHGEECEVRGRLLVGADGVNSQVRADTGIRASGWSYRQHAIVANVTTEAHHQHTAWQRFLPSGPLAFLPLSNGNCSIVWSCDDARADELIALSDKNFMVALQEAFEHRLGAIRSISPRLSFPLALSHARSYIGPRTALIGDAAHSLHPLAGQGANLGLVDAASLAEVVMDAQRSERDIGARSVLRRYERWRKGDNVAMMLALDGFKRLFGNDHPLSTGIRNFGLSLGHLSGPIKHYLMRRATGLAGDLPRLARAAEL